MVYNRNYGCRITDSITITGIRAIVMENEKLRITVLVDKGTDIYEFLYKPTDTDIMWRGPVKLQNPALFIPSTGNEAGTFMDRYAGGWQEILPNGGPGCEYKGAKYGQHGELSNVPWDYTIVEDNIKTVSVKFSVRTYRSAFYLEKTLSLKTNDPTLYINEFLVNEAEEEMKLMWGNHPTIGLPFLSSDCKIETSATVATVHPEKLNLNQQFEPGTKYKWPIIKDRADKNVDISNISSMETSAVNMFYLSEFEGEAQYNIINKKKGICFGMKWDKDIFKYLWMWQAGKCACGYPWYGRAYCMALEPWTSYPTSGLDEAIKNGTALTLQAHQSVQTNLSAYIKAV